MTKKIRVIVIDDSAFMRKSISLMLESDPEIEVVALARDGLDGLNRVKELKPDIITLDIEMPRMDGLTALEKIMQEQPTPVIMVSSLTTEGAEATLRALELGAVDFIPKELSYVSMNIVKIKEDLIRKVKEIVRQKSIELRLRRIQRFGRKLTPEETKATIPGEIKGSLPLNDYKAVAMGISTGGPMSLQKIIPKLSKNLPCPVLVVQHMPPKFTKSLAERLNSLSEIEVKEAENNETIKKGVVYIAQGGYHMKFNKNNGAINVNITEEPSETLHRPSVDVMIKSALSIYGGKTLGVIMTGMGKDGVEGVKDLKDLGGSCIVQDEASCVVYGMPKAIVDNGLADVIAPLEKISDVINRAFKL